MRWKGWKTSRERVSGLRSIPSPQIRNQKSSSPKHLPQRHRKQSLLSSPARGHLWGQAQASPCLPCPSSSGQRWGCVLRASTVLSSIPRGHWTKSAHPTMGKGELGTKTEPILSDSSALSAMTTQAGLWILMASPFIINQGFVWINFRTWGKWELKIRIKLNILNEIKGPVSWHLKL